MKRPPIRSVLVAAVLAAAAPAMGESLATSASSAGSSASSAGSASSRGSSDSIDASSNSSRQDRAVADGEYRVARVASVDGKPGTLRLAMTPEPARAQARDFTLDLPQHAFGNRPPAVGDRIRARHREYGLEFARADTGQPFFLVLDDAWQRDLQTRVLTR